MKSAMLCGRVKVPETRRIAKLLMAEQPFASAGGLAADHRTSWDGATYREERYVAVELLLARRYAEWITFDIVPLAEHLIVTGAWWDHIDSIAPGTFGRLLEDERGKTVALLETLVARCEHVETPIVDTRPAEAEGSHRQGAAVPADRALARIEGVLPAQGDRLGAAGIFEDRRTRGRSLRRSERREPVAAVPARSAENHQEREAVKQVK